MSVYDIQSVGEQAGLKENDPFKHKDGLRTVRISFETLWKNWIIFDGQVPQFLDCDWEPHTPWQQSEPASEVAKSKLFEALLQYASENPMAPKDVARCLKPM